jgi:hypothetical protein
VVAQPGRPCIIAGTAISVIGSGLITTLSSMTAHAEWIAYFLICGFGTGCAINLPYTAVCTILDEVDMVTGNGKSLDTVLRLRAYFIVAALLQLAFQLGGAVSLCISQTVFLNRLTSAVKINLPGLSIEKVIKAGAYDLPALKLSPVQLETLRLAYQDAARSVFVFLLVTAGLACLASFGFEHKNVRKIGMNSERVEDGSVRRV